MSKDLAKTLDQLFDKNSGNCPRPAKRDLRPIEKRVDLPPEIAIANAGRQVANLQQQFGLNDEDWRALINGAYWEVYNRQVDKKHASEIVRIKQELQDKSDQGLCPPRELLRCSAQSCNGGDDGKCAPDAIWFKGCECEDDEAGCPTTESWPLCSACGGNDGNNIVKNAVCKDHPLDISESIDKTYTKDDANKDDGDFGKYSDLKFHFKFEDRPPTCIDTCETIYNTFAMRSSCTPSSNAMASKGEIILACGTASYEITKDGPPPPPPQGCPAPYPNIFEGGVDRLNEWIADPKNNCERCPEGKFDTCSAALCQCAAKECKDKKSNGSTREYDRSSGESYGFMALQETNVDARLKSV
ncbi:MAG: hypothetical protein Q9160_005694 [Pyrenula sp. 1 TL-2023]